MTSFSPGSNLLRSNRAVLNVSNWRTVKSETYTQSKRRPNKSQSSKFCQSGVKQTYFQNLQKKVFFYHRGTFKIHFELPFSISFSCMSPKISFEKNRSFVNYLWCDVFDLMYFVMVEAFNAWYNVAQIRFPDSTSHVRWLCWFSSLHRDIFLRFFSHIIIWLVALERLSIGCRKIICELLWFCITSLSDCFKVLVPLFQPIRSETKTNGGSRVHIFPRFVSAMCNNFEIVSVLCDWPK